jgi:outer membrane protein assembly factor BamB
MRSGDKAALLVMGGVAGVAAVAFAGVMLWRGLTLRQGEGRGAGGRGTAFTKKWEFAAGGPISGALALSDDGTVIAASEDGFLYAVDGAGNLQWKFNAGEMMAAPAIGADGTIYVTNGEERIFAINRSGTQQWAFGGGRFADKNMGHIAAALDENHLYTPWRAGLHALRLSSGYSDWTAGIGFKRSGAVSVLPNGMVLYTGVGRLDAVFGEGRTVWEYPVMDPPLSVDMITNRQIPVGNFFLESGISVGTDGTVYACGTDSRVVALTWGGAYKWEFKTKTRTINRASPLISVEGTIYFASEDGTLYALTSDGAQKWAVATGGPINATPLLASDGTIYVVNTAALVAVSPDGEVEERFVEGTGGESSPTLGPDGTIYVVMGGSKILAIAGRHGGLANSSWPKFQHDLANTGRGQPI